MVFELARPEGKRSFPTRRVGLLKTEFVPRSKQSILGNTNSWCGVGQRRISEMPTDLQKPLSVDIEHRFVNI